MDGQFLDTVVGSGRRDRLGQGAVETALVGLVIVHSRTALSVGVGRCGEAGPIRATTLYADRIVDMASRSGSPAVYAAWPSIAVVVLRS